MCDPQLFSHFFYVFIFHSSDYDSLLLLLSSSPPPPPPLLLLLLLLFTPLEFFTSVLADGLSLEFE